MGTRNFCILKGDGRFSQTTLGGGNRHDTLLGSLGPIHFMEEHRLGSKDLPLGSKGIVVRDLSTITSNLLTLGVCSHKTNRGLEVLFGLGTNIDTDEVLEGLEDDFLTISKVNNKAAAALGQPVKLDGESSNGLRKLSILHSSISLDTIDPELVGGLSSLDLKSLSTNAKNSGFNVGPVADRLVTVVDIHSKFIAEARVVHQDQITSSMVRV